jgi:membrane fusion protein, macrolide-specific efflux system
VANPDQALMTQMTAQVFFIASSAKDAVLVPLTALRPVAAERRPRGTRGPGAGAVEGKGEARSAGADPRKQFANGRALVSVVNANGKVADREVKVGVMNRVSAQIIAGLEPGERVVIGTRTPAPAARAQTGSSLVPSAAKAGTRP